MNYYLDTEFLEGKQKEKFPISLFRKETPNTIDLISIGIVAEDGREYYAISKDFNLEEAWNRFQIEEQSGDMRNLFPNGKKVYWIRENVLKPIFIELFIKDNNLNYEALKDKFETIGNKMDYKWLKSLINKHGKTNKEIAKEIRNFIYLENKKEGGQVVLGSFIPNKYPEPKFYAYYADYDWVAFCWLFGKMMDLPKGFPMYCNDLKQMLNEKEKSLKNDKGEIELISEIIPEHDCAMKSTFDSIKDIGNYPKQENEHSALDDARWNKELYKFLNKL